MSFVDDHSVEPSRESREPVCACERLHAADDHGGVDVVASGGDEPDAERKGGVGDRDLLRGLAQQFVAVRELLCPRVAVLLLVTGCDVRQTSAARDSPVTRNPVRRRDNEVRKVRTQGGRGARASRVAGRSCRSPQCRPCRSLASSLVAVLTKRACQDAFPSESESDSAAGYVDSFCRSSKARAATSIVSGDARPADAAVRVALSPGAAAFMEAGRLSRRLRSTRGGMRRVLPRLVLADGGCGTQPNARGPNRAVLLRS
jgi:hypothetical protein